MFRPGGASQCGVYMPSPLLFRMFPFDFKSQFSQTADPNHGSCQEGQMLFFCDPTYNCLPDSTDSIHHIHQWETEWNGDLETILSVRKQPFLTIIYFFYFILAILPTENVYILIIKA